MAQQELRRPENVPGDFFVDGTCIDCDLCRQIAPGVFHAEGDQSAVYRQPADAEAEFGALKALVVCPTASIGKLRKDPPGTAAAAAAYPELIAEDVYFCGFASESSYGASSYLIVRPDGNVLVDSPRFNSQLADRIEKLGGVRWMFLTHRDDVADHQQWVDRFAAARVFHKDDAGRLASDIEILLEGHDPFSLADDLLVIPTPGHTRGHCVLLYRNKFLFTGDHLWWSDNYNGLHASRSVSWYSWPEQVRSVYRLLDFAFEWVLPGHGRRCHVPAPEMRKLLEDCLHRIDPAFKKTQRHYNTKVSQR